MKIILVNGPPRSGKDTTGEILRDQFGAVPVKFAAALKRASHSLFDIDAPEWLTEAAKDSKQPELRGKTLREIYIAVSEQLFKPLFGQAVFGEILADEIANYPWIREQPVFVVTDSGFIEEAQVLTDRFGAENVLLIRLYRNGCDFSGDSRNYLDPDGFTIGSSSCHPVAVNIENAGTLDELAAKLRDVVSGFLGREEVTA